MMMMLLVMITVIVTLIVILIVLIARAHIVATLILALKGARSSAERLHSLRVSMQGSWLIHLQGLECF